MPALMVLFFCSGACGLTYQVLWLRQLSHVFGVTAYAASTVLAAFMMGLALGGWLAGPLLSRVRRPLAVFGVTEFLIGASAVATPAALGLAATVYRFVYSAAPDSLFLHTTARVVCASLVLLVPTVLMGLTFPVLCASSLVRKSVTPARISALYAANTAGAVGGALLTGHVLIGAIGMRRTFLLAAAVNTIVALAAIAVARREDMPESAVGDRRPPRRDGPRIPGVVWAAMAASGFGALGLEVVWFRLMTQYADATTYAFTNMLAVVLVGIALGGGLAARVLARERNWLGWAAVTQLATGALVILGIEQLTWDIWGNAHAPLVWRLMAGMLLPSLLLGFSFPLLLKLGVPASSPGDTNGHTRAVWVGRLYTINVFGAVLGSLAAGFALLPLLGTRRSFIALAALFVVSGVTLCLAQPRRALWALGAASLVVFAVLASATGDPHMAAARLRGHPGSVEIFRDEGVLATVSVDATQFERRLRVGGLHQANDTSPMVRLHRSIGLLPMALHPEPKSALVVGLGGGATAGAVSRHVGTSVQIVEYSDGVRRAAAYFSHISYDVLNAPNVRLRVDDGRNFLMLSGEGFDVITADLIQPVHAGAGNLYSREYFRLVRAALNPGGVALQWIGEREKSHYTLIMRTFLDVFPDATVWLGGQLMVGSLQPLRLNEAAFNAKLADPQTREALAAAGLPSYATLRTWYTAGPRQMAAFVGPGPVLTDDRPLVEYHRSLPPDAAPLDLSALRGDIRELDAP